MHNYPKITLSSLETLLEERFSKEGFLTLADLPHPSVLKDMDRATERIVRAIESGERIALIGDYDVDGVISTAIMKLFFDEIGYELTWIIPNRFKNGYGLSPGIIPKIKEVDLAITVDNGISAVDAAEICSEMGIDLIITDHHLLPPKLPKAYAIIDQKQEACDFPYADICGAQIAWYLIASLKNALNREIDMISYMELVSIAVIADMMPLKHINRAMVRTGLASLSKSDRPAVRAFMEYMKKEHLSSEDISFFLAPLLNSAGRMKDASYAVEFLLSTNIYDARVHLGRLLEFNQKRKLTEADITKEALACVDENDDIIVVSGREWHEGVVGIVAARVARACRKPAIVLSENSEGKLKGSGRSFGDCDLFAVVEEARPLLEKFGGHFAAIGLSLDQENLYNFRKDIQNIYREADYRMESVDPDIVGELLFRDITFSLTSMIQRFEPYGQENPLPKFISKRVKIVQATPIGSEKNHLRFLLEQDGVNHQAIQFKTEKSYEPDTVADIIYTVNENHFRGNTTLQLMIDRIEPLLLD